MDWITGEPWDFGVPFVWKPYYVIAHGQLLSNFKATTRYFDILVIVEAPVDKSGGVYTAKTPEYQFRASF